MRVCTLVPEMKATRVNGGREGERSIVVTQEYNFCVSFMRASHSCLFAFSCGRTRAFLISLFFSPFALLKFTLAAFESLALKMIMTALDSLSSEPLHIIRHLLQRDETCDKYYTHMRALAICYYNRIFCTQ